MSKNVTVILACLLLASLTANGQDVVHLKGGQALAGKLADGLLEVELETSKGTVRIPWNRIDRIDRSEYVRDVYRARAEKTPADDAAGHFLLALWCRRQGLEKEMRVELEKTLAIDSDHDGARSALGHEKVGDKWVAGDQILAEKGFVRSGNRWILEEEAAHAKAVKARRKPLSEKEEKARDLILKAVDENPRVRKYARAAFENLPWSDVRIPLFRALGRRDEALRAYAVSRLGAMRELEAARPLLRTAILDTSKDVRAEAVKAIRALEEPSALFPMVRALASPQAQIRANAADAVGGFSDIRGVEYLISTLKQNWGPSARVNLSVMNQISYIRDFDVEIAQAAQIGDPIVGVLREGVVLDYRVLGVDRTITLVERRAIRSALMGLTDQDFGDDAVAWEKWWKKNRERLLADAG